MKVMVQKSPRGHEIHGWIARRIRAYSHSAKRSVSSVSKGLIAGADSHRRIVRAQYLGGN